MPGIDAPTGRVSLPVELYRPILEQIDDVSSRLGQRTMCALSLTSRNLRTEAQRILFYMPWIERLPNSYILKHLQLLKVIIDSPDRLALLVAAYAQVCAFRYCIRSDEQWKDIEEEVDKMDRELSDATARGLRAMVNLKALDYCSFNIRCGPNPLPPSAHLLRGCQFQLNEFSWGCDRDEETLLNEFFPTQKRLKRLCLASVGGVIDWQALAFMEIARPTSPPFPDLVSLSGPRGVVDYFLPGSSVRYLDWTVPGDLEHYPLVQTPLCQRTKDALSQVELISYFTKFSDAPAPTPPLSLICESLVSTSRLEIFVFDTDEEYHLLKKLPNLKHLLFYYKYLYNKPPLTNSAALEIAKASFAHCPSLDRVDVGISWDRFIRHRLVSADAGVETQYLNWNDVFGWNSGRPDYFTL